MQCIAGGVLLGTPGTFFAHLSKPCYNEMLFSNPPAKEAQQVTAKLRKLFGGLEISWKRLILFAVVAGIYTGIMAILPAVRDTSFHDIAKSFEWWVFFGILIITNSRSAKESALKCFVFFLISQPLVYLVQAPFHPEGLRLFRFYPGWFVWTLCTIPMGCIGYWMKQEKWWALLILTPVLLFVGFHYESFLSATLSFFPRQILSAGFCAITMLLYPLGIFENKKLRRAGLAVSLAILLVMTVLATGNQKTHYETYILSSGSHGITLDETCSVRLTDESCGDVEIVYDEAIGTHLVKATFSKDGETQLIVTGQDGTETVFTLVVENSSFRLMPQGS